MRNLKSLSGFFLVAVVVVVAIVIVVCLFVYCSRFSISERISVKTHGIESRFV